MQKIFRVNINLPLFYKLKSLLFQDDLVWMDSSSLSTLYRGSGGEETQLVEFELFNITITFLSASVVIHGKTFGLKSFVLIILALSPVARMTNKPCL